MRYPTILTLGDGKDPGRKPANPIPPVPIPDETPDTDPDLPSDDSIPPPDVSPDTKGAWLSCQMKARESPTSAPRPADLNGEEKRE